MNDDTAIAALEAFSTRARTEIPVLKAVLDEIEAGTLDRTEGMQRLMTLTATDPSLKTRLESIASEMTRVPEIPVGLFDSGVGAPRLDPLYEAALLERIQFDDDVPELRTGPLSREATPAVSVTTTARDPAVYGLLLDVASRRVLDAIEDKRAENTRLLQAAAENTSEALVTRESALLLSGLDPVTDTVVYPRGRVPEALTVATPDGATLGALTVSERREHAWRFLSTTQGRRSAVDVLRTEVVEYLTRAGFEVVEGDGHEIARHDWAVRIDDASSTQPAFSSVNVAAKVAARGLVAGLGTWRGKVSVIVTAVNTVDVRKVGWSFRLSDVSDDFRNRNREVPEKAGTP